MTGVHYKAGALVQVRDDTDSHPGQRRHPSER